MKWLGLWAVLAVSAGAATINVDTTTDTTNDVDGLTSLREAVIWANTNAGVDTIEIPAGLYVRTIAGGSEDNAWRGDLDVKDNVFIHGAGATNTIIDAAGLDRVFFFDHDLQVTISDLTLRGGSSGIGSGIYNESTAHVIRCSIESNDASFYGGGVHNFSGILFVEDSTIWDNVAHSDGAGGVDVFGGSVILSNSTVAGNASFKGGGLNRDGGAISLYNCTVAYNFAVEEAGGIYSRPNAGLGSMASTLVANNICTAAPDFSATANSLGYNLIGDTNGAAGFGATDLYGTNALLDDFQYHGGSTLTFNLLPGSPAINRADPGQTPGLDQRGLPRPRGRGPDIGAFEEQSPDEDLDGIPDEWEMQYGLDPTNASDAAAHSDADGFNNLDEYVADTIPTNGESFHRLLSISIGSTEAVITFQSSSARVYGVEYDSDLANAWVEVTNSLPGQSGSTSFTNAPPNAMNFYRTRAGFPAP